MNNHRSTDLLSHVADSTHERDEVRRTLTEPLTLTEADLDAQERYKQAPFPLTKHNHAHRYSACVSGPCQQGSKLCPTPDACQRADDHRPPLRAGNLWRVLALVLISWAAVALVLIASGLRL